MAFTRQQVLEMQQKLASLGYKDTDFEILRSEIIDGEEYLAIVHNGVNMRVRLADLEASFVNRNIQDIDEIRQGARDGAEALDRINSGLKQSDLSDGLRGAIQLGQRAYAELSLKQDKLRSGRNIKTINGASILGSGNLEVGDGSTAENAIIKANENVVTKKIWSGTQAQYDVLVPSDDTIYFIKES